MKKFLAMLAAAGGLLSGCVAYDEPPYRDSTAYRYDRNGNAYRSDGDRDRDGVPNRRDADRDGDGVRNTRDQNPDNPRRY